MAQSGYTPISIYYSTTASAVPTAGNLANGELALNIADMKLYAKNSAGTVTLLASNASTTGVDSLSFGSTGLTPSTATTGAITVAGTLATTNGGTGRTSYTANSVLYASSTSAIASGSTLTFDGNQFAVTPASGNAVSKLFGGTGAGAGSYFAAYGQGANSGYFGTDSGVTGSGTSNDLAIYAASTNNIRFYQSGAEQMRITSAGLVIGTGTNVNSRKLSVNGIVSVQDGTSEQAFIYYTGSATQWVSSSTPQQFWVNGAQRFVFGTSGQLGIAGANYGSAGQVLTSAGSGSAPTWSAPAGGSQAFVAFGTVGGYGGF